MAVNETLFGAAGVSDPIVFEPGLTGIMRKVDFAKANTTAGAFNALIAVPKSFVVTGAFIELSGGADCGAVTVQKGEAETALVTATAGEATVRAAANLAAADVCADGAMYTFKTANAATTGVAKIVVYGYQPYGDSLGNVVTPAYRKGQTDADAGMNRGAIDAHFNVNA